MHTQYEWIATAAFGLEGVVARELERLNIPAKAENGGARFEGAAWGDLGKTRGIENGRNGRAFCLISLFCLKRFFC